MSIVRVGLAETKGFGEGHDVTEASEATRLQLARELTHDVEATGLRHLV